MKFFEYLDCKYVEKNLELSYEFSLFTQAETHAIQNLIATMRCLFRWLSYPKIVCEFILVCLNLRSKPLSIKERQDAAKAQANLVSKAQG